MLSHMEQDRAFFAQMEAEILDIEAQMAALVQSRRAVRDAQELIWERLQSYKYPVLSLPNEIVAEIFIHTIPPYPDPPPPRSCPSTVLTQICRQWRETAIGTPQLWKTIYLVAYNLPIPQRRSFDSQQAFRQASLWVKRSGSCPLSVYVEDLRPILPVLLPERMRLEHLRLSILDDPLVDLQEALLPSLRSLDLTRTRAHSQTHFSLHSAPLLRSVIFRSTGGGIIDLPWAQLTFLKVWIERTADFRRCILRQARRLVHCAFYCRDVVRNTEGVGSEISLHHLESLEIRLNAGGGIQMDDVLESLMVPNLQILHVSEATLGPQPIETLKYFISKSHCKLKKMEVVNVAVVEPASYRAAFTSIARVVIDRMV
ncbi:F-box domain-containing protein [Favolaschia claudopus]|uniref:F-box domain-containing protein n=1 Tax=Favolaschia claudopus TaxID=2862362 RepID=A0AAW0C2P6_9AGAR